MCSPLHFVVINDELLLQYFYREELARNLFFGEHHFSEVTFTENSQKVEVVETNFALWRFRGLFIRNGQLRGQWRRLNPLSAWNLE
jgi:hypothetical protein